MAYVGCLGLQLDRRALQPGADVVNQLALVVKRAAAL